MRGIIILCLLSFHFCFAQKIEVVVKDNKGQKLSNINVQLQKNGRTLDFQKTQDNGVCFFTLKESGVYGLKITSMQYKTQFLEINTDEKQHFQAILEEQHTEIKEVVIKSRPKISKVVGDTIAFNISAIKDGTERTAEDLIKKIPGLDISDNGKVTHNGNTIGQVLIDGNEFFGKNHKMATQNITADMLEGIDLWKQYTTINGNTSTALNLKLKNEYKGRITGNADLHWGNNKYYSGHANLFRFTKVGNLALISDFNNIAKNPISFSDFHEMNQQEEIDKLNNASIIKAPSFLNNDDKIQAKDNQFGALQYSKSWKNTHISAFGIFNVSQLKKLSQASRTALEGQSVAFDFQESKKENNHGFFGTSQIKIRRTFQDKSFIYYNFGFNPIYDNFQKNTERISLNNSLFDINNQLKKNTASHFISWNKPMFQHSKMIWAFSHIGENFDEDLNLASNAEVFKINNTHLLQNYSGTNRQTSLDFYWKSEPRWIKSTFRSGYKITDIDAKLSEIYTDNLENQSFQYHRFVNSLRLSKSFGNFEFSTLVSSNHLNSNNENRHFFENNFNVKYRKNGKSLSNYGIEYSTEYQLPNPLSLFQNLFYTRDLIAYKNQSLDRLSLAKHKSWGLTWNKFNVYSGNLSFLILKYSQITPFFTTDTYNYNTFSEVNHLPYGKEHRWFLLFSNHQTIGQNLILKSKLTITDSKNQNFIQQQINEMSINIVELSQILSSNFKVFPIQFDLGYKIHQTNFSQSFHNSKSKNDNLKFSLGLRTNIKEEWKISILGDYLIQKTYSNRMDNFLLGGHFSYKKNGKPLEYHFSFHNILNLNSFRYISNQLSSFGYQENITTALQGYMMIGVKYHWL